MHSHPTERDHELKVLQLRQNWNAPRRHLECKVDRELCKPWTINLEAIVEKLGTGFLIGLCGGRGNGKTQLAVELMKRSTDKLRSAEYTTITQILMAFKATFSPAGSETEAGVMAGLCHPIKLLVIDEVGKRSHSDWEGRLLFEMVNRRYNAMLDTLFIDNQRAKEFAEALGPSISSRMMETGGVIEANWPSFRKQQSC